MHRVRAASSVSSDTSRADSLSSVSAYGWKFDKDEFLHRMREAVEVPVINVKEELA